MVMENVWGPTSASVKRAGRETAVRRPSVRNEMSATGEDAVWLPTSKYYAEDLEVMERTRK